MPYETILFDLDGTLIDTNKIILASFQHTFEQYDMQFTTEELIQFNGPPLRDTFYNIDAKKAEEMIETYRKHNIEHHDAYVTAFPYAVDVVRKLSQQGFKLGIVTTKMRPTVTMGLSLTGLDQYFDTVITYDDVDHPKPHPQPVQIAMEQLGATIDSTLMIGDSSQDIESGQRAQVATAGVSWTLKGKDYLQSLQPTYMLEDMRDVLTIVGA